METTQATTPAMVERRSSHVTTTTLTYDQQRFYSKVDIDDNGCFNWTGNHTTKGYGTFWLDKKRVYAHRWAYEDCIGPIPKGLQLDHLCRNRRCCNPEHLEPVTREENLARGKVPYSRNHCSHNHIYTESNTYVRPDGTRVCRTCKAISKRKNKK